jgi:hypothetical protein
MGRPKARVICCAIRGHPQLGFAIAVVVGIIAALIAVARHYGREGLYVGIVEKDFAADTDRDGLQDRAYVDEALVHELLAPSKLTGRMIIRETNTSVPLTFVRVPLSVANRQSCRKDAPPNRHGGDPAWPPSVLSSGLSQGRGDAWRSISRHLASTDLPRNRHRTRVYAAIGV